MVEVSQGFPEITVSARGSLNGPGATGIKLDIDFASCSVTVDELTSTNTGSGAGINIPILPPAANAASDYGPPRAVPIAWRGNGLDTRLKEDSWQPAVRRSRLAGKLEDRAGIALTRVEINRSYTLSQPLRPGYYRKRCSTNSVFKDHILWINNTCIGEQSMVAGRIRAWARGRFHAVVRREDTSLNRDSRHTTYLLLEATANGDVVRRCTFSPYGIRHLEATFAPTNFVFWLYPGGYGVRVDCDHSN